VKCIKYKVTHTTEYYYNEPVPLCHNLIRLCPRDTAHQKCVQCKLTISPEPAERRDRVDFFGNNATWVSLQEPHKVLRIEAVSEVEVRSAVPPPSDPNGPSWESVADLLSWRGDSRRPPDPVLLAVREYTFDSPQLKAGPELADYARPSFPPGRPLVAGVTELTERIYDEFTFDSRATTVGTPVLEVLRNRRGVCQDFAHLQVGCLRSLGLPARYVSGYVLTRPPPGQRRLVGADASHAWISVFFPGTGWVDFDPTNNVLPSTEHVTLGWARDYDDVSPVKGVIIGGHRHSMYVGVTVEPVLSPEEAAAAAKAAAAKAATAAGGSTAPVAPAPQGNGQEAKQGDGKSAPSPNASPPDMIPAAEPPLPES
jgi:transglutaminase-like putative cysteine protease